MIDWSSPKTTEGLTLRVTQQYRTQQTMNSARTQAGAITTLWIPPAFVPLAVSVDFIFWDDTFMFLEYSNFLFVRLKLFFQI